MAMGQDLQTPWANSGDYISLGLGRVFHQRPVKSVTHLLSFPFRRSRPHSPGGKSACDKFM